MSAAGLRAAIAALERGDFAGAAQLAAASAGADARYVLAIARACLDPGPATARGLLAEAVRRPQARHPVAEAAGLLAAAGRHGAAAPLFAASLAASPRDARLLVAHAQFLLVAGDAVGAAAAAQAALAVDAAWLPARVAHGVALAARGALEEAIALFRAIVAAHPDHATAWSNLGKALAARGDFAPATDALDRAVRLRPADRQIALNRAIALLKAGDFSRGWEAFCTRFEAVPAGAAGLRGRRVQLLHREGFGDTLQFLRFAPVLAAAGSDVIAAVPPQLARLAASVAGVGGCVEPGTPDERAIAVPFLSLGRVFGVTAETIPNAPYLSADPAAVARIGEQLADLPRPLIGVCWAGGVRPRDPGALITDRARSMAPDLLAPLGGLRGTMISLQKGREDEGARLPFLHAAPIAAARDFADTAAIVAHLDAVVSVDTAVVHLAGGMGRRVLLLDRYDNCWRWLAGRTDSPWYPGLSIHRQERPGDWSGPVASVIAALRRL